MSPDIEIIKYKEIKQYFHYGYEDKLIDLNLYKRMSRVLFDHFTYIATYGLHAVSQVKKTFELDLRREGYNSDDYKRFPVEAFITNESINEFEIVLAVKLDDYGFPIHEGLGLETMINNSSLKLEVKDIEMLKPEIAIQGHFEGHGYDFALAEEYKCIVELTMYGILKESTDLPSWKIKFVKALIAHQKNDYETVLNLVNSAFEMFLKEQGKWNGDFKKSFNLVLQQSGLVKRDIFSSYQKKLVYPENLYRRHFNHYYDIRQRYRNENVHEEHKKVPLETAETFAVIALTFIYSIVYRENRFTKSWIKGIEKIEK